MCERIRRISLCNANELRIRTDRIYGECFLSISKSFRVRAFNVYLVGGSTKEPGDLPGPQSRSRLNIEYLRVRESRRTSPRDE